MRRAIPNKSEVSGHSVRHGGPRSRSERSACRQSLLVKQESNEQRVPALQRLARQDGSLATALNPLGGFALVPKAGDGGQYSLSALTMPPEASV